MNTFSKKSLHVALAGLSTLGLAGAAEAVMVNPNGLGQVLVYPYYTVRNGYNVGGVSAAPFNTLLSIVNTTASTKAVKVRFREGKASKEVLDFNVFLSPYDMWTAAIEPDGAGGAMIETGDNSCTIPSFTKGVGVPFRQTLLGDAIGASADRVTEGYFEVFEMATYLDTSKTAISAKHNSSGVPSCKDINDPTALSEQQIPLGGLSGGATIINVLTGDAFTEDATALVQYIDSANYENTGAPTPDFTQTFPTIGAAVNGQGQIISGTFAGLTAPVKAATAAFQRTSVINEFVLDKTTASGTDWVLTFPTKHHHLAGGLPPFQNGLSKIGSCDDIGIALYNREEGPPGSTPGSDFSPLPPGSVGPALCWESNVLTFSNSNVLGSGNKYNIATAESAGWMNLTFAYAGAINIATSATGFDPTAGAVITPTTTFAGLPTIGFAVQTFVNGTLTDTAGKLIQSSYGGNFGHRYVGPQ